MKKSIVVLATAFTAAYLCSLSQVVAQSSTLNQIQRFTNEGKGEMDDNPFGQVNAVSQLSDVSPNDWAFTALQSLVERYGCIAGYPNQTFRGNRPVSRYEFAAGVNACLDKINEVLAQGLGDKISREDLAAIQRLQEEFAAELATLRGRVDSLEAKVTTLEAQQFSTTTKLFGQAIFGAQGRSITTFTPSSRNSITLADTQDATNLTFGYNVQLSLFTQFTPRSFLLTGLQFSNIDTGAPATSPVFLTNSFTGLAYEGSTNNRVIISDLSYRQQLSDNFAFIVGAAGVNPISVFRGPNRYESAGQGPVSAFAQRNPILALGSTTTGAGFDWQISPRISLQGVYSVGNASATAGSGGLFDGSTVLGVQLNLAPADTVDVALNYLYNFNSTGSLLTGVGDTIVGPVFGQLRTNAIGATLNWRIDPKVVFGVFGGYTNTSVGGAGLAGTVETTNWMTYFNFPDLFRRGDLLGIYVGQPPKITSSTITLNGIPALNVPGTVGLPGVLLGGFGGQPATTTHLEVFYRYRISDNISLTPGVIFVFNPYHTISSTVTIGTLRTTFSF
ncbi:MAG: iron uptake porin [Pseudanabaenaceae cyanobacterium]